MTAMIDLATWESAASRVRAPDHIARWTDAPAYVCLDWFAPRVSVRVSVAEPRRLGEPCTVHGPDGAHRPQTPDELTALLASVFGRAA